LDHPNYFHATHHFPSLESLEINGKAPPDLKVKDVIVLIVINNFFKPYYTHSQKAAK
jgi:hypothetical protein